VPPIRCAAVCGSWALVNNRYVPLEQLEDETMSMGGGARECSSLSPFALRLVQWPSSNGPDESRAWPACAILRNDANLPGFLRGRKMPRRGANAYREKASPGLRQFPEASLSPLRPLAGRRAGRARSPSRPWRGAGWAPRWRSRGHIPALAPFVVRACSAACSHPERPQPSRRPTPTRGGRRGTPRHRLDPYAVNRPAVPHAPRAHCGGGGGGVCWGGGVGGGGRVGWGGGWWLGVWGGEGLGCFVWGVGGFWGWGGGVVLWFCNLGCLWGFVGVVVWLCGWWVSGGGWGLFWLWVCILCGGGMWFVFGVCGGGGGLMICVLVMLVLGVFMFGGWVVFSVGSIVYFFGGVVVLGGGGGGGGVVMLCVV